MRATRTTMKLYALGLAAAAALTTTACEQEGSDKTRDTTSPSASAARTPDAGSGGEDSDKAGSPDAEQAGGSGGEDGAYRFADRQTPPTGSVCDNGGQGPYGAIQTVNFGGEAPNTVVGMVLGHYDCAGGAPVFKPTSATGAAMDVLLDDSHLKVVVGGTLATDLGTNTPDVNTFVKHLAEMEGNGELGGPRSPQFYFRIDGTSDDVNTMPDNESHIIYLHQVNDGD